LTGVYAERDAAPPEPPLVLRGGRKDTRPWRP
jgi:hypothetical protein